VLTGEETFTRHAQLMPGTSVFGEASAACLVSAVNYRTAVDRGLLAPGDRYLVATVGSGEGATFAAMVFEH
jgi:3-oxoacyl-[acyl-carrier-protein] synthase-3